MSLSNRELGFVAPEGHSGRLWQNRDYLLLWGGQAISATGSTASELALPLLILSLTHSPVQAGLVGALHTIAILFTTVPAGALVDRWNRKYTMLWCDAGRAVALASIPLALALGHLTAAQLYLVALIEGSLATFFELAQAASIPRVVRKEQLPAAIGQQEVTAGVVTLLGPSLGGMLYGLAQLLCAGYLVHPFRTRNFEKRETKEKRGVHVKRERAWFLGEGCRGAVGKCSRSRASRGSRRNQRVNRHTARFCHTQPTGICAKDGDSTFLRSLRSSYAIYFLFYK
jgi:hypothetical protein